MTKNTPEGAELSDILIFPILRKSEFFNEQYVTNFGYISSENPCEICKEEITPNQFRPTGWEHHCRSCDNFMVFVDITKYVNAVAKKSRNLTDIRSYLQVYYAYKGREGLNNHEIKLVRSAEDVKDYDEEE